MVKNSYGCASVLRSWIRRSFRNHTIHIAENAGLNPISLVTELRNQHNQGNSYHGVNVKKGEISDMWTENVVQPALVNLSEISLSTECVGMILKIDDLIPVR